MRRERRDGDLNGEVGTENVEFFSLLMANGQSWLKWLNRRQAAHRSWLKACPERLDLSSIRLKEPMYELYYFATTRSMEPSMRSARVSRLPESRDRTSTAEVRFGSKGKSFSTLDIFSTQLAFCSMRISPFSLSLRPSMDVTRPTTSPFIFNNGPPLLPGWIGTVV